MAVPKPRTRRQLREALRQAENAAFAQRDQTRHAEERLRSLGATEGTCVKVDYGYGYEVEHRYWDTTKVSAQHEANDAVDAMVATARTETRAATLRTVLEALQISGYTRRDSLREELRRLSAAHNSGEAVSVRDRDTGPSFDTDSFWADLQTALEVRAERKATDERAAAEKKVASIRSMTNLAVKMGVEGNLESFAETAAKLADEPTPKKKPAKKKQENAK